MGCTVDHDAAHAADTLAAVVVEGHRFLALDGEILIQQVEHVEERHLVGDVLDPVLDHLARALGIRLAPYAQVDDHL